MQKKERKLTANELRRKEEFEAKSQELIQNGYEKKDLTIGVVAANVWSIVIMLPFVILFFILNFAINFDKPAVERTPLILLLSVILLLVLFVVHELIHGLMWGIFAENHFKSIEFGIIWSMVTPYCTCKTALKKWQYILGAMMPTIIVGFIPTLVAILINNNILFFVGILMIFGGGGDMIIILKLLFNNEKGKDSIYIDHPYECGLVMFEREKQ